MISSDPVPDFWAKSTWCSHLIPNSSNLLRLTARNRCKTLGFGRLLITMHLIQEEHLEKALSISTQTRLPMGKILVMTGVSRRTKR